MPIPAKQRRVPSCQDRGRPGCVEREGTQHHLLSQDAVLRPNSVAHIADSGAPTSSEQLAPSTGPNARDLDAPGLWGNQRRHRKGRDRLCRSRRPMITIRTPPLTGNCRLDVRLSMKSVTRSLLHSLSPPATVPHLVWALRKAKPPDYVHVCRVSAGWVRCSQPTLDSRPLRPPSGLTMSDHLGFFPVDVRRRIVRAHPMTSSPSLAIRALRVGRLDRGREGRASLVTRSAWGCRPGAHDALMV